MFVPINLYYYYGVLRVHTTINPGVQYYFDIMNNRPNRKPVMHNCQSDSVLTIFRFIS